MMVSCRVERNDWVGAIEHQVSVVNSIEYDSNCSAGQLGDAMLHLTEFCVKAGQLKRAQFYIVRAIGFLRIYYGKNHEKVSKSLDLAKFIQTELIRTGQSLPSRRRRNSQKLNQCKDF
jgi:hypothetical protein